MAISTLTAEHVGMGLMVIGVVIFAGMLTIRLFSSSGDWPLLLPIAIIGVVISYVGFALVLADNSRRARSCECSCTVSASSCERESDILGIIEQTRDARIIYWLVERYLQPPEVRKQQAVEQLANLMPLMQNLLEQAGVGGPARGRR